MNIFLICPVRNQTPEQELAISNFVHDLETQDGHVVHWPPRDTWQHDETGLDICRQNRNAIADCDIVYVWWDGKSEGRYFDLGMAFAMGKKIQVVYGGEPPVEGKCYERMVQHWSEVGA